MADYREQRGYLDHPFQVQVPTDGSSSELLEDKPRGEPVRVILTTDGDKVVVGTRDASGSLLSEDVIFEYITDQADSDRRRGGFTASLRITREAPERVTIGDDKEYTPNPRKLRMRGIFERDFFGLRPQQGRQQLFVGTQYRVQLVERTNERIVFDLSSTQPMHTESLRPEVDPIRYLTDAPRRRILPPRPTA